MIWTPERVELLSALWADGHSASEVARHLGGTTRNAVIGKVYRLGLQRSAPSSPKRAPHFYPEKRRPAERTPSSTVRKVIKLPKPAPEQFNGAEIETLNLQVHDLTDKTCRYPVNAPRRGDDHLFCGHETHKGKVYCQHHCTIAYRPMEARN